MKNNPIPLIMGRIFNTPLMIHEPKLDVILWALRDRLNIVMEEPSDAPERYKLSAAAKNATRKSGSTDKTVAIIPVFDTLVHKHAMMQSESGMTSYLYVRNTFRKAMASNDISAVVMLYDSSGGEVNGNFDLADEIYSARGTKPIIAFVDEIAFSGAYSLASSADTVIMPRTGGVGSIGVLMRHANLKKFNEAKGIEYTTLYAGARKIDFSSDGPLTEEAYEEGMSLVNSYYDLFVNTVARNRNLTTQHIKGTEAALYWGRQAIAAGLADEIGTLDDAIERALEASMKSRGARNTMKGILPDRKENNKMERFTTLAALEAEYPEYAAELRKEGKDSVKIDEAAKVLVLSETERILGLAEVHFGAEVAGKFKAIIASGISAEQYRAIIPAGTTPAQVDADRAESKVMGELLEAITKKTGQQSPGMGGDPDVSTLPDGPEKWKAEYERDPQLQAEFRKPEHYTAYKKGVAEGRVKILGRREVN